MTLRLRLVAIIGLSLTLLWSVGALWMFMDVRQQLRSALDERLAASARMVAGLVARLPAERLQLSGPAALPLDVIARDGLACEVSLVRSEVAIQPIARTATSPGLEGAERVRTALLDRRARRSRMRSAGLPHDDAAAGVRVELQTQTSAARLAVPEALLVSALRNLLDNALRLSPRQESVALQIERLPGQLAFCVPG